MILPPLTIRLFGPLSIELGGEPLPRVRTRSVTWLLALLVLRSGRAVDRAWLAGTLWPESDEPRALQNLRNDLTRLRQALGPEAGRLQSPTRDLLVLDLHDADVDVHRFDSLVRTEGAKGATGVEARRAAVELYTGPLLEGCLEEWIVPERATRAEACLQALEALAEAAVSGGDPATALGYLRRAETLDPLRDATQRHLMCALAADGDVPAAVMAYREFRLRLHRELNAEPDAETTQLFHELRSAGARAPGMGARSVLPATQAPIPVPQVPAPQAQSPNPQRPTPNTQHPTPNARGPHGATGPSSGASPTSTLPRPLTPLIGREREVQDVAAALATGRLVTLVGGGGVGKTRLAIEVARELEEQFEEGVAYVTLAALADPALLPSFVAAALEVETDAAGESCGPVEALVQGLGRMDRLLVLDNCEHLLAAALELVQELLERCPGLSILATSRQRLGLAGEITWRVPSLPAPDPEALPGQDPAAWVLRYPAGQLFVERTAMAHPGFRLASAADARAVAKVCRRLDGIPLALELAAARASHLTIEEIALGLDDRFRLLSSGRRSAIPRHRTLQTLIDWSYDLLDADERRLLRRLSVFAGGWTLETAEAIAAAPLKDEGGRMPHALGPVAGVGTPDEGDRDPLNSVSFHPSSLIPHPSQVLAGLVDKSLVLHEKHKGGERYRFLETIREYARERLAGSGEAEAIRRRHRDYFQNLAETASEPLKGPDQAAWLDRLRQEHQNIRAALAYCWESPGGLVPAERIIMSLYRFWYQGGHVAEAREHLRMVLAQEDPSPEAERARVRALEMAGSWACHQGDLAEAREMLEQGLAVRKSWNDRYGIGSVLGNLAIVAVGEGRFRAARDYLGEALEINQETGNLGDMATNLFLLGFTAYSEGDYQAAREYYTQALERVRVLNDPGYEALWLNNLGRTVLELDNLPEALALQQESLRRCHALRSDRLIVEALDLAGAVHTALRDYQRASRLYGAAGALRERLRIPREAAYLARAASDQEAALQALGAAAYTAALAEGQALSLERAIRHGLES